MMAPDPMQARDVDDCFTLFLGRVPDLHIARQSLGAPLAEVLGGILRSPEFQSAVLAPLLLREALPQATVMALPPPRLIDWAQRRLPLGSATQAMAGSTASWLELLEVVLSDPAIAALAPNLAAAGIDRLLRERLANQPLSKITRAVIGAIDAASSLEIRGWAVDLCDRNVPVPLELYADSLFIGAVTCGEPRADVQEAVGGDGRCGFTFRVPAARRSSFEGGRALIVIDALSRERIGVSLPIEADATRGLDVLSATRRELVQLRELLQRIEARLPDLERLASVPLDAYGDYWERFYRPAADALAAQKVDGARFAYRPLISVVLPTFNSDLRLLDAALRSVSEQSYDHFELIVTDDASAPSEAFRALLRRHADERLRVLEAGERAGIAGNTNRGIAAARGEYIAFLDHDDLLAPEALYEVVRALQEHRYGLVYSDEDRIEENAFGRLIHHTPFFKPDFDPDLLLSLNYLCHLVVLRRDVLDAVGTLHTGIDGAQDHDLLLRASQQLTAHEIRHVPKILYHWRVTPGSVSHDPAHAAGLQSTIVQVVQAHLDRCGAAASAEAHADPFGAARPFATRVRWQLPAAAPRVSIIVPTRDRLDLLGPCIDSLLRTAAHYPGPIELLIVDNDSVEGSTHEYLARLAATSPVRVLRYEGAFNWSAINNFAAQAARGDVLIFLNNDTVALSEDWCAELTANALRPEVGAVGARLLYEDGTLQHAGVVLGVEGVAGHESSGEAPERGGYFGRSHLQRGAAAVTGACLATRRELFRELGGFDEVHLPVAFNDVDFCLRVMRAGYRVLYDPFAVLYHFESKSRGYDLSQAKLARQKSEAALFRARWALIVDLDPFYNPHFERHARPFDRLKAPP